MDKECWIWSCQAEGKEENLDDVKEGMQRVVVTEEDVSESELETDDSH